MNQKTKEILKAVAFIVIPFASVVAVVHYAPKVKEWYIKKKEVKKDIKDSKE